MRVALLILLIFHSLIHLLGFLKAFNLLEVRELTLPISKPFGILWMLSAVLMLTAAASIGFRVSFWWAIALAATLISQFVIACFWADAKYGTVVNLILMAAIVIGYASWKFEQHYIQDVKKGLERTQTMQEDLLGEEDIAHLPDLVQGHLRNFGAINKPKVHSVRATFHAEMRSKTQDWFPLSAQQHNFFDRFERLFFLDAQVKGLPTQGYHRYTEGTSLMHIKLLSLIPVADESGTKMFEAETVTMFNDMCFLAPATLIDKSIQWETLDEASVRATFTNSGVTISAVLHFNEKGQLVNFVSDDRYDMNKKKKYRFSTPLSRYQNLNGYTMPTYGEATWHYPDGPFVYGKYWLENLEYNPSTFQKDW